MERNEVRKVWYYTENPNRGFDPNEEVPTVKQGFFHTWGEVPWENTHDESFYKRVVAVVEEAGGQVIEVSSEWTKFEN